jgi:O-antigen ligase
VKTISILFSKLSSNNVLLWTIALTFLLLPTGTAPPLIGIAIAFVVWIVSGHYIEVPIIVKTSWFRPVILFFILPWLGLIYSLNLDLGTDYAMKTKYWIFLFVSASCNMGEKQSFFIVKALWVGLLAGALLAFAQLVGLVPAIHQDYLGFGIVHTLLSMYLIVGILMAAFYFKRVQGGWAKAGILSLIIAFLFHLAVLRGRGGYVVFVLLSPLIANELMYKFSVKAKVITAACLVMVLLLSPVVRERLVITVQMIQTNKEKIMKGEIIEDMVRFYMATESLKAMKNNPILGAGTGSLYALTRPSGHPVGHPHNNILYMGASFGIVGIFSCLWLFGTMLIVSWRARQTPLGYFILSSCLVLFLGGMFDTQILNTGTLLMLVITYGFLHQLPLKIA